MKTQLKDYFVFTKKERIAVIILLFIISLCIILPYVIKPTLPPLVIHNLPAKSNNAQEHKKQSAATAYAAESDEPAESTTGQLFYFDPNTLDEAGWIKLGLPPRVVKTILNYRNKGGHFYNAEGLRKIYSLTPAMADRIIPYAVIKNQEEKSKYYGQSKTFATGNKTSAAEVVIDINTATAEEWKALPGIGEVLSNRIVKFRDRMGGFNSIEQVGKTYGLKDSVFQLIRHQLVMKTTPTPAKFNINKASDWEMYRNGAIDKDVAKAIVIYRNKNGQYKAVSDIKAIPFITEEMYNSIAGLLTVE